MTTPPSDAREALLTDLAERALGAVQPEIDRLRTNLTTVFHQLKAAERESEQRLGELLFWHFEYQAAMDNYKGENWQVGQLRTELEQARATTLHEMADRADPQPPEVSWFGKYGQQVGAWIRMQANSITESAGHQPHCAAATQGCCSCEEPST